jgi:Retrotransposon gag protein
MWYRAYNDRFSSWAELKAAMISEFLPYDYEYFLRQDIDRRVQGEKEPFSVLLASMEPMFRNLSNPPTEEEKLETLRRNMDRNLAQHISVYVIESVDHLSSIVKNWERYNKKNSKRKSKRNLIIQT